MSIRGKQFREFVKSRLDSEDWVISTGFGISNRLLLVESGIEYIDVDLGSDYTNKRFSFLTFSILPTGEEIYYAIYLNQEAPLLWERLQQMRLTAPTNNVKFFLPGDGRMYYKTDGRWEKPISADELQSFDSVSIDFCEYCVFTQSGKGLLSPVALSYISHFEEMVMDTPVSRIYLWQEDSERLEKFKTEPSSLSCEEVLDAIQGLGGSFAPDLVRELHIGLTYLSHKHFVILSGISGTGKTLLAQLYSSAVHGIAVRTENDPFFIVCAVRPDWTDPTELLGYYDPIQKHYRIPAFLNAVLLATAHKEIPVYVLLDEMNLARVEYYFADVLSSMESGKALRLHDYEQPLEGANRQLIPPEIALPNNLYMLGTINIDETTHSFSDKILDRAVLINMSEFTPSEFFDFLQERKPELAEAVAACRTHLEPTHAIVSRYQLSFGKRLLEEAVAYYHAAIIKGADHTSVLDHILLNKVLTKLRGTERDRQMLTDLKGILRQFPSTMKMLDRLESELDEYQSFQYAR